MTREEELVTFLTQAGWNKATRIPFKTDASARTYERLILGDKTAILMNSPQSERPDLFVFVDNLLSKTGARVPQIFAQDVPNGFILLEDFGDNTFTKLLATHHDEFSLYKMGVESLIQVQKNVDLTIPGIPLYTHEQMIGGVMMFPKWFCQYVIPGGISEEAVQEFREIWEKLIQKFNAIPKSINLLDYHVDNLMITPDGACGLLDFQDARIGPATYDLMSLLEDERRQISEEIRKPLLEYYFKELPQFNTPFVHETLSLVAMHRHTRVIGVFVRLFVRDKKEKYLSFIPFIWSLCETHLHEPMFSGYRAWLDKYVPLEFRHKHLTPKDFPC